MNSIESNFVSYQTALDMKLIGFDEPCFAVYYDTKEFKTYTGVWVKFNSEFNGKGVMSAPLYQQAFRWFREKYRLYPIIDSFVGVKGVVKFFYKLPMYDETFNTYEEAESACLDKLIEICKNK